MLYYIYQFGGWQQFCNCNYFMTHSRLTLKYPCHHSLLEKFYAQQTLSVCIIYYHNLRKDRNTVYLDVDVVITKNKT